MPTHVNALTGIDMRAGTKLVFNSNWTSIDNAHGTRTQIKLAGGSLVEMHNGDNGTRINADIIVDAPQQAAVIRGIDGQKAGQGNLLKYEGTISGQGTLQMRPLENGTTKLWTVNSTISNGADGTLALQITDVTVALAGANTYTGGTEISNSTVTASDSAAFGTGTVALDNSTLKLGNGVNVANAVTVAAVRSGAETGSYLEVAGSDNATLSGGITGSAFSKTGSGSLTLTGADTTLTGQFGVRGGGVTISNATVTAPQLVMVDKNGGNASLTIADGGKLQITGNSVNSLVVAGWSGGSSTGTLTVESGGQLVANDAVMQVSFWNGVTGTVNVDGGSVTTKGISFVHSQTDGTISIRRGNLTLSGGGVMTIGSEGIKGVEGNNVSVTFGDGTIKASDDWTMGRFTESATLVDVSMNGTTTGTKFDTDGHNVTIQNKLAGTGSLVKAGAGTLKLADVDVAGMDVQAGVLELAGAVTLRSAITSAGTVNFNGATFTVSADDFTNNRFDVVTGSGTTTGTLSMDSFTVTGDHDPLRLAGMGSSNVYLLAGAGEITWNGTNATGGDAWGNANWLMDGSTVTFVSGDTVHFTTAAENKDVAVSTDGVTVGTMDIAASGYTFSGGAISATSLTLGEGITATFQDALTVNNAVTLNGSTLKFATTGPSTIGMNMTGAGNVEISGSGAKTIGGKLTNVTLTMNGSDTLGFTQTLAMEGGKLVVNSGTVTVDQVSNGVSQLKGTAVEVNGGGTLKVQHDTMGWANNSCISSIRLAGTSETELAVLDNYDDGSGNDNRGNTCRVTLNLAGHALVKDTGTKGIRVWDGMTISATGTDNTISSTLVMDNALTVTVGDASTLLISGNITNSQGFGNKNLTKAGAGALTLTGDSTMGGLNLYLGTTTVENATVSVSSLAIKDKNVNGDSVLTLGTGANLIVRSSEPTDNSDAPLLIGAWANSSHANKAGILNMEGGTLSAASSVMHLGYWAGATGQVNALSGEVDVMGVSFRQKDTSAAARGSLTLGSETDGDAVMVIGASGIKAVQGNVSVTLGNGTIKASADWTMGSDGHSGDLADVTLNGTTTGTKFDTNGHDITIENKLVGTTGKLVKAGAGTLKLTGGANVGAMDVQAGTLELAGAVTLHGAITSAGTVNFNGATFAISADDFINNRYDVVTGTGTTTGTLTLDSFTVTGDTDPLRLVGMGGGKVFLYAGNGELTWDGTDATGGQAWGNSNWTMDGATASFFEGDTVHFTDTAANKNVTVADAGVTAGAMDITASGYTFSGGSITATSLTMGEGVTATFQNTLTTGGDIALNGSTLKFDTNGAYNVGMNMTGVGNVEISGSGAKTIGGKLTDVTLTMNGSDTLGFTQTLAMERGKLVINSGTVTLDKASNGASQLKGTAVEVNGGGTLVVKHNMMGWGGNGIASILLQGESETNRAILTSDSSISGTGSTSAAAFTLAGHTLVQSTGTQLIIRAVSGASITATGTDNEISATVAAANPLTIKVGDDDNPDSELLVSGNIAGGNSVTKTGSGKLTLTGSATNSGAVTVQEGVLALSGEGNIKKGNMTLSAAHEGEAAIQSVTISNNSIAGLNGGGEVANLKVLFENSKVTIRDMVISADSVIGKEPVAQTYGLVASSADGTTEAAMSGSKLKLETGKNASLSTATATEVISRNDGQPDIAIGTALSYVDCTTFNVDVLSGTLTLDFTGMWDSIVAQHTQYVAVDFNNVSNGFAEGTTIHASANGWAPVQAISYGSAGGHVVYFEIAQIPEPATATLSLLALAGILARRRRRH